jgi:hypothetical protein
LVVVALVSVLVSFAFAIFFRLLKIGLFRLFLSAQRILSTRNGITVLSRLKA